MKAIKLITIIAAVLALTACGASKKAHQDDPWAEFSIVKVDTYKDGKIIPVEYASFIGKGVAPTQYFAEKQAESDALARMAEALTGEPGSNGTAGAKISGATRVGETMIRFDQNTRMYTVYVRMGLPKKKWESVKK